MRRLHTLETEEMPQEKSAPAPATHVERLSAAAAAPSEKDENRKKEALDAVTAAIQAAKRPGVDATQQEIADAVLKGIGLIFGENPFTSRGGEAGWGGTGRGATRR